VLPEALRAQPRRTAALCRILRIEASEEQIIGEFLCAIVDPPLLTPELVAAIKSHPRSPKAVRAILGCNKCPSKLRLYAAFERDPKLEAEGLIWYAEITDNFACECGATNFEISTYKRNFFSALLQPVDLFGQINVLPRYKKALSKVYGSSLSIC
jgi:hypothetical protein